MSGPNHLLDERKNHQQGQRNWGFEHNLRNRLVASSILEVLDFGYSFQLHMLFDESQCRRLRLVALMTLKRLFHPPQHPIRLWGMDRGLQ